MRIHFPIFLGSMLVVGVYFVVFVVTSSDEEFVARGGESNRAATAVFMILWVAAVLYVAYQWLWRVGTKVVVDDDELTWSSVLRSRVVPLSTIVRNDASSRRYDLLLVRDQTALPVLAADDGWLTFLAHLAEVSPQAQFVMVRSTRFRNGFVSRNKSGFRIE